MENNKTEIDFIAIFNKLWQNRKKIIIWSVVGLIIGVCIAISIPKEYTSMIKVAPEGQSGNASSSLGAIAGMMGVGVLQTGNKDGLTIDMYPEILTSSPFLLEFANINVSYKGGTIPFSDYLLEHTKKAWWKSLAELPGMAISWVVSIGSESPKEIPTIKNTVGMQQYFCYLMKRGIQMSIDKKSDIIKVETTFQDPVITKIISDSVLVKLQKYIINYRSAKTRQNLESNLAMLEQAKDRYYNADLEYAQAQDKNQNLIAKSAAVKLDRLRNERDLAFQIYQQLATQVEADKIKLHEEQSIATVIEPATTPLSPSAPNKLMIIVVMTLFGGFVSAGMIVIKNYIKTTPC